ncbi:MAG: hypothetical protein WC804_10335 [Sphingomonas sp.]|jgi:hypothetical protein|uniref:hypothetical protein n=1 Tax=Sphingomonas sp. TaxID=28214 RepID=UPI00356A6E68
MAVEQDPVVKRDAVLRAIILAVLMMAAGLTIKLSRKPIMMTDRSWVAYVAPLPAKADARVLANWIDNAGTVSWKYEHKPGIELPALTPATPADAPLMVGYSLREKDAFGMPFAGLTDEGWVIYRDRGSYFETIALTPEGWAGVEKRAGVPFPIHGVPPLWRYFWGWLFFVALAGYGWFEAVAARHRREAAGVI